MFRTTLIALTVTVRQKWALPPSIQSTRNSPPERFAAVPRRNMMRYLAAAVLILLSGVSPSFAQGHIGTPQEQQACRRDASRLCRQQLADDFAVQQCLQQNRAKLSKACQKVFASHGM
jgi:hypothetical protein